MGIDEFLRKKNLCIYIYCACSNLFGDKEKMEGEITPSCSIDSICMRLSSHIVALRWLLFSGAKPDWEKKRHMGSKTISPTLYIIYICTYTWGCCMYVCTYVCVMQEQHIRFTVLLVIASTIYSCVVHKTHF